jgi:hypothetical protein
MQAAEYTPVGRAAISPRSLEAHKNAPRMKELESKMQPWDLLVEILGNLSALSDLSGQWIDLVHGRRPPRGIVLDMDA